MRECDGEQFFGQIAIDAKTRAASVTIHDRDGRTLYTKELAADAWARVRARDLAASPEYVH